MNPLRYNSFNQIHKGLRAFLYDTALQLQHTDLSDQQAGNTVLQQIEEVLLVFESHAHNEDRFFNEPLEKTNPEVAVMFEKEHVEDHRLAMVLQDLIIQWRTETTDEGRSVTGRNLFYAFNEFIAFNLYHMNKEELELNVALWKHYSDAEIRATEQTLVQQTPPEKMMIYARWMICGINNTELVTWLSEVRAFAPAPVFSMLIGLAEQHLPSERFDQLTASLRLGEHASTTAVL